MTKSKSDLDHWIARWPRSTGWLLLCSWTMGDTAPTCSRCDRVLAHPDSGATILGQAAVGRSEALFNCTEIPSRGSSFERSIYLSFMAIPSRTLLIHSLATISDAFVAPQRVMAAFSPLTGADAGKFLFQSDGRRSGGGDAGPSTYSTSRTSHHLPPKLEVR